MKKIFSRFRAIPVGGLCGAMLALLPLSGMNAQNPIIRNQFSADPTARVFNGRLYVFPSHDIISPVEPERKWFSMADYHVFSTDNLTDWTDHGVILSQEQVPWGNPTAYSMWAPDCVQGADGRYYFYFPDAPKEGRGFGVGVAIADNPWGPYKAQPERIKGLNGIDPCVLQASNGQKVIFWGAGGIVQAKLKDNMLELDGEPQRLDYLKNPPSLSTGGAGGGSAGLQEGPFAFERNGKYYLTYPWVRYKKGDRNEKGEVLDNPTEALVYCISDSPMGPWEYKGVIMKEHENGCWTNHHSIVEYKGQWYLFYHHNDYSPNFDKNRSVCADSLFFNADGTIQEVKPTLRGIGVTDVRSRVQMDRYSHIGGGATIAYNDTTNCFLGWKTILPKGGWVSYGNTQTLTSPTVKGKESSNGSEAYTVWVCMPGNWGRSQVVDIKTTTLSLDINRQPNGLSELMLRNNGDKTVEVDWISIQPIKGSSPRGFRPSRNEGTEGSYLVGAFPLVPSTSGGLTTGSYRNLFVEAGYAPEAVDKKVKEVFNDVFFGKNKCYFEVGKDMAYISDVKNNDVRTEGMSYGLMIAVQMDRRDIFDKLWRWSKKYMQMTDGPMKGYFRWSCKTNGTPNANGPASDGELYYITSLIFASNRWGNNGEINYLKEAQYILDCIQPKDVEMEVRWENGKRLDTPKKVMRRISLIDEETGLITFVPGMKYTDPSYHLPAFYEVWARYAEDGRASYWRECARKSREYLHKSIHPMTGLNPDCNNFDGSLMNSRAIIGDAFRYDSWRVPMNIALDYSWSCSDREWQQNYGHTIQNFLYSQGVNTFLDQYNVDGTTPKQILKAGNYPEKLRHSIGFVATAAAASIMCSHPKAYEFIDALWNAKHEKDADGFIDVYYDALLRLFAFMHLSGNYRVIEKTPQMEDYLVPLQTPSNSSVKGVGQSYALPDDEGFVRRWLLRNPIDKPNRTNTVFTDSYLNTTFPSPIIYKKGDKAWTAYDSQRYNVKLYRLATCTKQQRYGVIFWATTVIECDEDIEGVRFGIGSNSASKWWMNGEEVALLSGDRRMVRDDVISRSVTLKKGRNVITGAVINGPGMSDFCFRLIDKNGNPLKNVKIKATSI